MTIKYMPDRDVGILMVVWLLCAGEPDMWDKLMNLVDAIAAYLKR